MEDNGDSRSKTNAVTGAVYIPCYDEMPEDHFMKQKASSGLKVLEV